MVRLAQTLARSKTRPPRPPDKTRLIGVNHEVSFCIRLIRSEHLRNSWNTWRAGPVRTGYHRDRSTGLALYVQRGRTEHDNHPQGDVSGINAV